MNKKENIIKSGYSVEVIGNDIKKVIWEVADNNFVEEDTDHDEIGLWGFNLNFSGEDKKGVGRKGSSEFPYLLMLVKLQPVNLKTQLKRMNLKVDKENGKATGIGNERYQNIWRFSINEF